MTDSNFHPAIDEMRLPACFFRIHMQKKMLVSTSKTTNITIAQLNKTQETHQKKIKTRAVALLAPEVSPKPPRSLAPGGAPTPKPSGDKFTSGGGVGNEAISGGSKHSHDSDRILRYMIPFIHQHPAPEICEIQCKVGYHPSQLLPDFFQQQYVTIALLQIAALSFLHHDILWEWHPKDGCHYILRSFIISKRVMELIVKNFAITVKTSSIVALGYDSFHAMATLHMCWC